MIVSRQAPIDTIIGISAQFLICLKLQGKLLKNIIDPTLPLTKKSKSEKYPPPLILLKLRGIIIIIIVSPPIFFKSTNYFLLLE
jgi:hypothetical protein